MLKPNDIKQIENQLQAKWVYVYTDQLLPFVFFESKIISRVSGVFLFFSLWVSL